jgi:ADP-ribose pyrophosphatase
VLMSPQEVETAIHAGDLADSKSISSFFLARSLLSDS